MTNKPHICHYRLIARGWVDFATVGSEIDTFKVLIERVPLGVEET